MEKERSVCTYIQPAIPIVREPVPTSRLALRTIQYGDVYAFLVGEGGIPKTPCVFSRSFGFVLFDPRHGRLILRMQNASDLVCAFHSIPSKRSLSSATCVDEGKRFVGYLHTSTYIHTYTHVHISPGSPSY